jgi:hypothetical protein
MNELQVGRGSGSLVAADVDAAKARVEIMRRIQKEVMQEGIHYGVIPGCEKPSLWQPGAQLLNATFKVAAKPGPDSVEDLSTEDECRYRITLNYVDQVTGNYLGFGIGECSSLEDKWAWKKANKETYEHTDPDRRRIKYGKDYETMQVRTNKQDVANTVLKIAKKRALVNGCLDVVAASEIFTQDVEDMDEDQLGDGKRAGGGSQRKDGVPPPAGSSAPDGNGTGPSDSSPTDDVRKKNKWISTGQERRLYGKCKSAGVDPNTLKAWYRAHRKDPKAHLWMITWSKVNPKDEKELSEYDRICVKIDSDPGWFAANAPKPEELKPSQTAGNGPASPAAQAPAEASPEPRAPQQAAAQEAPNAFALQIEEMAKFLGWDTARMDQEVGKMFAGKTVATLPAESQIAFLGHLNTVLDSDSKQTPGA